MTIYRSIHDCDALL